MRSSRFSLPVSSRVVLALLFPALLMSCNDHSGPDVSGGVFIVPGGPLTMDALGDSLALTAVVRNSNGVPLLVAVSFASSDTAVATVSVDGMVRSVGVGTTIVTAKEPSGATDSVSVIVDQLADSLEVVRDSASITLLPSLASVPVECRAFDRNGFPLATAPAVISLAGKVDGNTCESLVAVHSGHDTLVVTSGELERRLPIALALRPSVSSSLGHALAIDSLPQGMQPWAPTLIRNPEGNLDLYVTGYFADSTAPTGYRGHLNRLVSTDNGASFSFDGIALARDSVPCSTNGDGIENVEIVPRADAPGWRLFYSSGGFTCYGWQIFSAVSIDQRTWTREPGIRVDNGSPQPPQSPGVVPWPAGEGIVVDQLQSGEWRMISGSYERITPSEDKFQIVDWRSPDQITWTYRGPLLKTDDVGPEAGRSIYSPTIREFAPGIFRMIFTGDDLNVPGGRSRLYSAVSLDKILWQVEGLLLGGPATDIFYSTLVDDLLVFIRTDVGQPRFIGAVTTIMP